jgi:hypothetical protein
VGIELPGELADLLNELGFIWPKSDESALLGMGQAWTRLGDTLHDVTGEADAGMKAAVGLNTGEAIEAFQSRWTVDKSAANVLAKAAGASPAVGGAVMVCAGVVLALKINVIVQLTILLAQIIQAIATAPATLGVSLVEIPVFKKITELAINYLISQAMETILG